MTISCGIDWSERHHDIALVDAVGKTVVKKRIDPGTSGFSELLALIAEHCDDPSQVGVAVETDKGLLVTRNQAAAAGAGRCAARVRAA